VINVIFENGKNHFESVPIYRSLDDHSG